MADYREVKQFLDENSISSEQMDYMWAYMYDKNWKIANLTNGGEDWVDVTPSARKSLIKLYNEEINKKGE